MARWNLVGLILATVAIIPGAAASAGQADAMFVPARLVGGSVPLTPSPNVLAQIEEVLQVAVDVTGGVAQMTPLRASPLPADLLTPAVSGWRFQPALDQGLAVSSRVLVAAIFRPAQIDNSPTLGTPPVDRAAPSNEIPYPIAMQTPPYPPAAIGEGVVLVEVLVGVDGRVLQQRLATGAGGFDQAALDAASRWSFRPARLNGRAVEAYAYLVFGFRQPVVGSSPAVRPPGGVKPPPVVVPPPAR
jgi:TonB family protein